MARIAFAGLTLASRSLLCQRPVEDTFAGWRFSQEVTLRARADRRGRLWLAVFTPIGWRVLLCGAKPSCAIRAVFTSGGPAT